MWIRAPTLRFGSWSRADAWGALYFANVWTQVRRLVAEIELGLLSLGGQRIGAEQVHFAWPKIVEYLGVEHAEGMVLPVDARLKLRGRSLARPDVQDQPKLKPQWQYTEEGRQTIAAAITVPATMAAETDPFTFAGGWAGVPFAAGLASGSGCC